MASRLSGNIPGVARLRKIKNLVVETFGDDTGSIAEFPLPLKLATEKELESLFEASLGVVVGFRNALDGTMVPPFFFVNPAIREDPPLEEPGHHVSTGLPAIDAVMGGGLAAGNIYHVFGPPASGKTELCYHLTTSFLASRPDHEVMAIDADTRFLPRRLMEHGVNEQDLKRVHVSKCYSLHHLDILLDTVKRTYPGPNKKLLVVLDSIVAPALRVSVNDAIEQQQFFSRLFDKIRTLAKQGVRVVITNVAVARGLLPAGGDLPGARSDVMLRLERDPFVERQHVITAMKCPFPEAAARFSIDATGIVAVHPLEKVPSDHRP